MLAAWLAALLLLTGQPVDVALDPGHSRADIGAAATGLREYRLTLDLAERVRWRLEAIGLSVRQTREDDAPLTALLAPGATDDIRLEQEARIAAGMPARIYVSLHFNGGPVSLRGTETYFNPDRGDDWPLADALQRNVVASVGSVDRGVRSDLVAGKPYGHFFSLRGPVPSALVENLFLSNPQDAALLRDDATLDLLADGVAQGILEYLAGAGD
ncbi:MAG TPA: N-acetylmuramoyl-L-alanine amidase [Chloroflexota bacterium]|jgi:N-acetylmuramoyl-L-alanine amidase